MGFHCFEYEKRVFEVLLDVLKDSRPFINLDQFEFTQANTIMHYDKPDTYCFTYNKSTKITILKKDAKNRIALNGLNRVCRSKNLLRVMMSVRALENQEDLFGNQIRL
eukprot:NODE_212_length_14557_cov_0.357103.p11 type:complete len:108 gc:universal NODE_212_length_14557_cov_0.357103:5402-5079(-)